MSKKSAISNKDKNCDEDLLRLDRIESNLDTICHGIEILNANVDRLNIDIQEFPIKYPAKLVPIRFEGIGFFDTIGACMIGVSIFYIIHTLFLWAVN